MDSSVYRSSKNTGFKQASFRHVLEKTLAIVGAVREKPGNDWARTHLPLYIDLFSGKGCDPETGEPGSPLIFLEIAGRQRYPIEAHFYEREPATIRELVVRLSEVEQPTNVNYFLHPADNRTVVHILPPIDHRQFGTRFGVAYADPSNADLNAALWPLTQIARVYRRVDIVFNYAAASWKRQVKLDHYRNLLDFLAEIPKQKWLIRQPLDRFQWTMLLGTNYLDFKSDEKRYWHDVKSTEGKRLLEQVAYTQDELTNNRQMPLFGER